MKHPFFLKKQFSLILVMALLGFQTTQVYSQSCQEFTLDVTSNPSKNKTQDAANKITYFNMCMDDNVTFTVKGNYTNNNQSYTQDDATTNFHWRVIGNGQTVNTSGASFNMTFQKVVGYDVYITAVDVKNCPAKDTMHVRFRTSDFPFKEIVPIPDVCEGGSVELESGYQGVPNVTFVLNEIKSASITTGINSDNMFIPDGMGASYKSVITFEDFAPGQTVQAVSDIVSAKISIEHSYAKDLKVSLYCPTNIGITLFDGSKASGGFMLGEPITCKDLKNFGPDRCANNPNNDDMGNPYTYYWGPNSNDGNINNKDNWNYYSWYIDAADMQRKQDSFPQIKPNLLFQAEDANSWANFIGCPLNGDWTLEIRDNAAGDNGWVESWGLEFNGNIMPGGFNYTVMPNLIGSDDGDIWPIAANKVSVKPTKTGDVEYNINIKDEYGCRWDTVFSLYVVPGLKPNLGGTRFICDNEPVILDPNVNATSNTKFAWSTGATSETIQVNLTGTYSVTVTENGICPEVSTANVSLAEKPAVDFTSDITEGCNPLVVYFKDLTPQEGTDFSWKIISQEDGRVVATGTGKDTDITIEESGTFDVRLIVTAGCTDSLTKSGYLIVHPTPVTTFTAIPEVAMVGDEITFNSDVDPNLENISGVTWSWDFGDNTIDDQQFAVATHSFASFGDYTVKFTVESEHNCKSETSNTVFIEAELIFPNIITPGNIDTKNDFFAIQNLSTSQDLNEEDSRSNMLYIYDRSGRKVYEAKDYDSYMKDGIPYKGKKHCFDGEGLPEGTYYYSFDYVGKSSTATYHGTITIIRK